MLQKGLSIATLLAIIVTAIMQWHHYWTIDVCTSRAYNKTLKCLSEQRNQTQCKLLSMQEYYTCTSGELHE